jgi:ELWxxDGT repeat protein
LILSNDFRFENKGFLPPPKFVLGDGVLYYAAESLDGSVHELWKTNGTPAGTVRVADLSNGQPGRYTKPLTYVDGRLYFADSDGVSGSELWRLAAASGEIEQVADVAPGADGSTPLFAAPINGRLVIWANDQIHGYEPWVTPLTEPPNVVVGRNLFYNNSLFDGHNPAATAADLAAVAIDKIARLPGQAASAAQVSGYAKGINGVLIEFDGAPADPLTAEDFVFRVGREGDPADWASAPAPLEIVPLAGSLSRYAITWTDGSIKNTWLQVTIKANARTRLAAEDVFFFGNLVGDTGDAAAIAVNAADLVRTRNAVGLPASIDSAFDFNRDGVVNAADLVLVRNNVGAALSSPPPAASRVGFSPIMIRPSVRDEWLSFLA